MQHLALTPQLRDRMQSDVESCLPLEACGLIAGRGEVASDVISISNRERSPTSFMMDPSEQLQAFNWIDARGLELVGIYHSHPAGPEAGAPANPGPSPTDIARAAYPVAYLIWSRPTGLWQVRGFWIESGRALDVQLLIGRP